jgi:hypothetical protein
MCSAMTFMKGGGTLFPTRAYPGQTPDLRHYSDEKPGVVAVIRSMEQVGALDMIPTTRKLEGIRGRPQRKTAAYSNYTP